MDKKKQIEDFTKYKTRLSEFPVNKKKLKFFY